MYAGNCERLDPLQSIITKLNCCFAQFTRGTRVEHDCTHIKFYTQVNTCANILNDAVSFPKTNAVVTFLTQYCSPVDHWVCVDVKR